MANLIRIPLNIESGRLQREIVLAEPMEGDMRFVIRSIPAFAYGLAYGDEIQLLDQVRGDFRLLKHNGQITVRLFVRGTLDTKEIQNLIDQVCAVGGLYEIAKNASNPRNFSLLLVSVDHSFGLDSISGIFSSISGAEWEYGNVYDEFGEMMKWCSS